MDKEPAKATTADKHTKRQTRRGGSRDGLFQRNGWWWIDYYDSEGKRHRKKAAPDYQTAKLIYRETRHAIVKGEILGVREEGVRLKEFIERTYCSASEWLRHGVAIRGRNPVREVALRVDRALTRNDWTAGLPALRGLASLDFYPSAHQPDNAFFDWLGGLLPGTQITGKL